MRPELQGIVDEAARLLDAPITLEDRAFDLVAYGSQRADVDFVRQGSILQRRSEREVRDWFEGFGIARSPGPVLTPADPARGIAPRLCLPARWRGVTYGYLWAYGWAGTVDDPRAVAAMDLAEHAGSYLAAQARRRESAATTLADLLSTDPDDVGRAVAAVRDTGAVRSGTPVVVVVVGEPARDDDLAPNLWRLPRTVLAGDVGGLTTLVVPLPATGDLRPARDAARQTLDLYADRSGGPTPGLVAGIGAPCTDLRQARTSWRTARLAARVAGVDPAHRPVAVWSELGAYRLLAADPSPELVVDPAVAALVADEPELARTAREFLDRAGNVAATADALGIHRQTLYHRLGRLEALTGLSVKRGPDRLTLHLALTLAPLLP